MEHMPTGVWLSGGGGGLVGTAKAPPDIEMHDDDDMIKVEDSTIDQMVGFNNEIPPGK